MGDVDVSKVKRVTHNFVRQREYHATDDKDFNTWKNDMRSKGIVVGFDHRNHIYYVAPTMDYQMYYNYLNYLNECSNQWMNCGYLDMGMVPYLMWPSFMDSSSYLESMKRAAVQAGVDIIRVPSVSLLNKSYISNGTDYWIFKEDLYRLAKDMESKNSALNFGFTNPDEVSTSAFVKELARFASSIGG